MNKCKNCNCDCHCSLQEHSDMLGICPCQVCKCDSKEEATQILNDKYGVPTDKEYVVDDTGECETCQQIQKNAVVCTQKKEKTAESVVKKNKSAQKP